MPGMATYGQEQALQQKFGVPSLCYFAVFKRGEGRDSGYLVQEVRTEVVLL